MTNEALLRILGYIWTAFGACWISFNLLRRTPVESRNSRLWRFVFLATTFIALFAGRHRIPPALLLVLGLAWATLGTRWAAPGKGVQSGEFKWYRSLRMVVLAGVFALLFWKATAFGFLGERFVPDSPLLGVLGCAAIVVGMSVALWSRMVLGKYWSDKVILQTEHRIVQSGPYSCMRHPIYSGVLLAVLGTALVLGEVRGLLSFGVLLANYAIKARREDQLLARSFPEQFAGHLRRAGFLLPRLG